MERLALAAGAVSLRPAVPADEPQFLAWLQDPEIYAYWEGVPASAEYARAHCALRQDADEAVWPFIILENGRAVGYLQAWWCVPGEGGVDIFLEPAARGRGIGSTILRLVAAYLTETLRWPAVTIDPERSNARAIGSFAKVGFVALGSVRDTPTHVVMTFDPQR
jgi:aminoglycoside 6'-N-acetyltransferase